MSGKADYFACYEAIAEVSARMLAAARDALWSDLRVLQEEYCLYVNALHKVHVNAPFDDSEQVRKYELLRQILADDAAIRDLAQPSVARFSAMFATPLSGSPTHRMRAWADRL